MFVRHAIVSLAVLTSACAAGGGRSGPVDVIRYNLGTPIGPGTFRVDPPQGTSAIGAEYQTQVAAVAEALTGIGFRQVTGDEPSAYILDVAFQRQATGERTRPAFSIGLGGGTGGGSFGRRGGGGVGVGGGVSTGIGGGKSVLQSELSAKLRRRTDSTVIWEGAARTIGTAPATPQASAAQADKLARALFKDFPGQSGITTTVP